MTNEFTIKNLLTCHEVQRDSGGPNLFRCFHTILADRFPFTMPRLDVFATLDGVAAAVPITVAIASEDSGITLCRNDIITDIDPAPGAGSFEVRFSGVTFPAPGVYRVRLLSEGRELASRRIHLRTL